MNCEQRLSLSWRNFFFVSVLNWRFYKLNYREQLAMTSTRGSYLLDVVGACLKFAVNVLVKYLTSACVYLDEYLAQTQIYIYICVCVCVCVCYWSNENKVNNLKWIGVQMSLNVVP